MYYGRDQIDKQIDRIIDMDGGVYFEAGANDGADQSNTLFFARERGWKGLLVEPIPQKFFDCVINRPESFVEWGALVPPDWDKPVVDLIYCNLMTITQGCFGDEHRERDHVERGSVHIPGQETFEFQARPWTISQVLDKYGMTHIDFMSIDLEGFERAALRGLDTSRHKPRYLLVEERDIDPLLSQMEADYQMIEQLTDVDYLFKAR